MNNVDTQAIIKTIPKELLELRKSNNLHKLAAQRTGIEDFGLDSAVMALAKKAYYRRHVNKAIAAGISSLEQVGE